MCSPPTTGAAITLPTRDNALRVLADALLRVAGPLGHEHDAFLGSGVNEVAARIEASVWRRGESTVGEFFYFFGLTRKCGNGVGARNTVALVG